jgi:O-antigen/teichoic acid export membrane protein
MSLFRKALLVNSAQFVCIAIGVGQNIILTRVLGPAGIGQYAVIQSVLTLAALVCCLGVPLSFLYHCQHDPDNTKEYLVNALWLLVSLGLIGGAVLVALLFTQTGYFGVLPGYALIAAFVHMPLALWQVLARNGLLIKIEARRLSIMRLVRETASIFLVLLFLGIGILDVPQAILCFVVACFVSAVLAWNWIRDLKDLSIRPSLGVCRKLILMGIRLNWADLMVLVNSQVSIFMVRYLLTDFEQVGFFSRGLRLAMLAVTASQAVLPLLFSRWAAFPQEHLAGHVEKVMRFASSIALAAIAFLMLAGKWVILTMYGREFLPAVKPMMILVPGTLLYLLSRILMQLLHSRGQPELSVIVLFAAALVNVVLCWLLVPVLGITGAAWAAMCCNILLLLSLTFIVKREYEVQIKRCLVLNRKDILSIIEQFRSRSVRDA